MKRALLVAAVLALAAGSGGVANAASAPAQKSAPTQKKDASLTKKQQAAKERGAVSKAKRTFIFSVEQCDRPDNCDRSLLADSEEAYVQACGACAPAERCEEDRQKIRDGQGKLSYNPCAEKNAKQ